MKGKRTYFAIAAMVLALAAGVLTDFTVLTPEVTAAIVTLLGALAAYFRSQA